MQAVSSKAASPVPTGSEDTQPRKLRRFATDDSALDFGQLLELASAPVATATAASFVNSPRTPASAVSASGRTGSVDKLFGAPGSASNVHGMANGKTSALSPNRMWDHSSAAGKHVGKADVVVTDGATRTFQMFGVEQRPRKVGDADPSRLTPGINDSQNASAQTDHSALRLPRPTVGQTSAHLQATWNADDGSNASGADVGSTLKAAHGELSRVRQVTASTSTSATQEASHPRSWREGLASPVKVNRTVSQPDDHSTAQVSLFLGQLKTDAAASVNGSDVAKPDNVLDIGRSDAPRELGGIVLRQVQAGPGEVRVKVHPEGLGDILVSVQRHADGVQVRLEGNQMQAVQWLSQQTQGIAQAIRNAGVDVQAVEIAFGQASLSQGSGGEQPSKRQRDAQTSWSTAVNAGGRATDTRFAMPELVSDSTHVNIRV